MQTTTKIGMMTMSKTYSELITIPTFEGRFEYLKIGSNIGEETFGFERYLNQRFYSSKEWKNFRNFIITRDHGCDLAHEDHEIIEDKIIVHHINPITIEDVINNSPCLFDPENAISVRDMTHKAIHYGSIDLIKIDEPITRYKNDTCPWK